jgi:hypothetical protein
MFLLIFHASDPETARDRDKARDTRIDQDRERSKKEEKTCQISCQRKARIREVREKPKLSSKRQRSERHHIPRFLFSPNSSFSFLGSHLMHCCSLESQPPQSSPASDDRLIAKKPRLSNAVECTSSFFTVHLELRFQFRFL